MASKNMLDLLPDELLLKVLQFLLTEDEPFWLELCTELPRFRMAGEKEDFAWLPAGLEVEPGSVTYPSVAVEQRLTAAVEPSQSVHAKDWRAVNSTCHRIKRLGKPLFFRLRQVAFNSNLPEQYETGDSWLDLTSEEKTLAWKRERTLRHDRLTNPWRDKKKGHRQAIPIDPVPKALQGREKWCGLSAEDQTLALSQMRNIILLDVGQFSPSRFVKLPSIFGLMSNITSCCLLMGYRNQEGIRPFEVRGGPADSEGKEVVVELRGLLKDIGASGNTEIDVATCKGLNWDYWRKHLAEDIFPMLRFRARLLEKSNGK